MGPAPRASTHPAMPGPKRLVRKSILATMRQGYTKLQAAATVLWVIDSCRRHLDLSDPGMSEWFAAMDAEATAQVQALKSPSTTRQENDHGDTSTETGRSQAGETKAGAADRP